MIAEVLPEAAGLAEQADVFLERGAFSAEQADRYLRAAMGHGLVARLHGDQFTEVGRVPLAVELGRASVDHLEATGPAGVAALAGSDVAGVLLPVAALYCAARAARPGAHRSGRDRRPGDRLQPGERVLRLAPVVMSLACTELGMAPAEALAACTVNAAWVLGRADRSDGWRPGYDADIVLLDAPDWRQSATTWRAATSPRSTPTACGSRAAQRNPGGRRGSNRR